MNLNKIKFVTALSMINEPSLTKKRDWDKIYNFKTTAYWNNYLWKNILQDTSITGEGIDQTEFINFCENIIDINSIEKIFNSINQKSRCILIEEFENYLEKLDDYDYLNIINSLEEVNREEEVKPELELEVQQETKKEPELEFKPDIKELNRSEFLEKSEEILIVPDLMKNDSSSNNYQPSTPPTTPSSEYNENESSFFKRLLKRFRSFFD